MPTTWYVDASATGANNGTNLANAWTALSSISTNMVAGDSCLIYSGTYDERWTVPESGTNTTTRMTFVGVDDGGGRPKVRGIVASGKDYISIYNLEVNQAGSASYAYLAFELTNCNYWVIEDCVIDEIGRNGVTTNGGFRFRTACTYNIIRNCSLDLTPPSGATGLSNQVQFDIDSNYNLVEYNTFSKGGDKVSTSGTWTVVRNNYMGPMLAADIPGTDPHIDDTQLANLTYAGMFMFERNFSNQNDSGNAHGFFLNNSNGNTDVIMLGRFNVFSKMGSGALGHISAEALYYNNTAIDNQNQISPKYTYAFANSLNAGSDINTENVWLNNSLVRAARSDSTSEAIYYESPSSPLVCNYNHIYGGASLTRGANNQTAAPAFTSEAGLDFTLQGASPLRATGGSLTLANGAGVATVTLIVDDARGFFDGWGIADADYIKIGSGAYVQISSINYGTDTITLSAARSWSDNDTVIVRGMEDIGAMPYGSATEPAISYGQISGTTATVTVADAFNVRFVEILVDGLPVNTSYSPSGNVFTITGVTAGTIYTARAYAMWPSETPSVDLQIYTVQGNTPARSSRNPAAVGAGF